MFSIKKWNTSTLMLMTIALLGFTTPVFGATLVYDFTTPTGNLGTTEVYNPTPAGPQITASGFGVLLGSQPTNLQGTANSGLGLAIVQNGAIGNGSDNLPYYVELDISQLLLLPDLTSFTITLAGFTGDGMWRITSDSVAGGNPDLSTVLAEGTGSVTTGPLTTTDTFLNILTNNSTTFVYLNSLTATTSVAVPEPETYLVLGTMLGAAAFIQLRRRVKTAN